tara:strand:- start:182 stop:1405 length:1224 start_codon:yes stop_codon:yes gene_type:complete
MPATIHFTPEFIKACEEIWRDGFNKGVNGEDSFPNFKVFFNDTKSKIKVKEETHYEELEKLPFNPSKCEARVEKYGFAIQCTRTPFGSGCLCKTHQNMLDKLPEGKDIRYGRFNQPRPDVTLDKGEPIKWGPKKIRSKDKTPNNQPKLKVGEIRDFLSTRIPNTVFKGMKKKELTVLYLKELEKDNSSSSSEEGCDSPINSPTNSPKKEQPDESDNTPDQIPGDDVKSEEKSEQLEEQSEEKSEEKSEQPEEQLEKLEEPEEKYEELEEQPEKTEEPEDDGKGTGLKLEPVKPKTIKDFKKLFDTLGIDYSSLNGRGAYNQAYDDYLKEQEEEKTEPMSDEEDDDDLQEDTHTYDNASWEGVDYLEDEETGYIFNLKHEKVAKWNENGDDFIWLSEEAKIHHENTRP